MSVLLMLVMLAVPADQKADLKADLKAIDDLHRREVIATKALDADALAALWTDDYTALPHNAPPTVGKKANYDLVKSTSDAKSIEVLDYGQKWEEIKVDGDIAYEWGTLFSVVKLKGADATIRSDLRALRILKRTRDGWKIHRAMWSMIPQAPATPVPAAPAKKP